MEPAYPAMIVGNQDFAAMFGIDMSQPMITMPGRPPSPVYSLDQFARQQNHQHQGPQQQVQKDRQVMKNQKQDHTGGMERKQIGVSVPGETVDDLAAMAGELYALGEIPEHAVCIYLGTGCQYVVA